MNKYKTNKGFILNNLFKNKPGNITHTSNGRKYFLLNIMHGIFPNSSVLLYASLKYCAIVISLLSWFLILSLSADHHDA